ncbi:MAG: hypothetical protein GQF41_1557 [Candidatus Rifleibacterium amylolyticum]|nr:MAG: hypothetical protein GQF41_1557 [Candidatus Rifleibacterium amylolyticum]
MNHLFAAPSKADKNQLSQQTALLMSDLAIKNLIDACGGLLMVFNDKRQLLCANRETIENLNLADDASLVGRRIGEIFGCQHSATLIGCGLSPWCRSCDANMAMLNCLHDKIRVKENAKITINHPKGVLSRCFSIKCMPYQIDGLNVAIMNLNETTRLRDLENLERYFMSDFGRAVTAIDCKTRIARNSRFEDLPTLLRSLEQRTLLLQSDIRIHRFLLGHDSEHQTRRPSEILLSEVINLAVDGITESPFVVGKSLERPEKAADTRIYTDWEILVRILQNLLLNAFEHTDPGRVVKLGITIKGNDDIVFTVWNHQPIIELMRNRIFQRHFSSQRESGRGLGTYAIKLLGEGFLGGQVAFETGDSGTTFSLTLKLK